MTDSINYGWVRLNRKLLVSDMWLSEPFTMGQAWIDLFANACHKESSFWVRGNRISLERGQIGWSQLTLSKRWKWSEGKVTRLLNHLKIEGQIEVQTSSKTTIITIVNYDIYQSDKGTNRGTNSEQTASRQRTYKNDKNDKNTSAIAVKALKAKNTDMREYKEHEHQDDGLPSLDLYSGEIEKLADKSTRKNTPEMLEVYKIFSDNPAHTSWYMQKGQREAAQSLLKILSLESIKHNYETVKKHREDEFCPKIYSPYDMINKFKNMETFLKSL